MTRATWMLAGVAVVLAIVVLLASRGCGNDGAPPDTNDARTTSSVPKRATRAGGRAPRPGSDGAAPGGESPGAPVAAETPPPPSPTTLDVRVLVDGTDEPVVGVVVNARPVHGGSSAARTDATGRARIPDVGPGLVAVSVDEPWSSSSAQVAAGFLVRNAGECILRVPPRRGTLRGRIELDGGDSLQEIAVRYRAVGVLRDDRIRTIACDQDGAFANQVESGRYRVWTEATGPAGAAWTRATAEVDVPGGPDVVLRLRRAARISGTVVGEGIGAGKFGQALLPVPSDGRAIEFHGHVRLRPFPGPFDTIPVDPDGDTDLWVKVGPHPTEPAAGWGVARRVRPDGRNVEVVVRPAWTLRVAAVDEDGNAVAVARLRCTVVPEGSAWESAAMFGAAGETSPDGTFVAPGLPPAAMTVTVGTPGADLPAARPVRVEPWTPSVAVTVGRMLSVSGRVIAEDGSTIGIGSVVAGWGTDGEVAATVGDDGRFVLHGLVPGRTGLRWVVPSQVSIDVGEVDVPAAGDVTLRVPISR